MEHIRKIYELAKAISRSAQREENRGIFGISTCGGIYLSWHLSSLHVPDIWVKAFAGVFTIVLGPPLSAFVTDLYKEKIKPLIFKNKKHRY